MHAGFIMINFISIILILISVNQADNNNTFAEEDVFAEYRTENFIFKEHHAKIVFPHEANSERWWIWRARFWGHEPQVDKALLDQGFHLAYIDVTGLYGNKEAIELWNDFYVFVTQKYNLNKKAVLEGMSRGGLIVYNWAVQNTGKVACIYADAPVLDIKSWPGGLYKGEGSAEDWEACLKAYDLNENSVQAFDSTPLNAAEKIAEVNIPIIHVCGDADQVVPYAENTEIFARRIEQAGGKIELIIKKGVGHHPHCLENPKPIVDFILKNTSN